MIHRRPRQPSLFPFAVLLLLLGGCSFVRHDELAAHASHDLSCPREQLVVRCVVGTNGSWMVTGCGRFAQYAKTSHGPRMERVGSGTPDESWLCAKGF